MKTKTIFKALALAMMMPAMMLPTACSNDNDVIVTPENDKEGYALPVTINVTREGDATTRAEYNDGTKTLAFSTGDKLFVAGTDATAGQFAGTLTWVSEGTFTGTIYTQYEYTGTADALLTGAGSRTATLLPDGYDTYEYLSISNPDSYSATLATDATKAFATSKAAAVEQLSLEQASAYSNGFALAPQNAILNFTVVTGVGYQQLTPCTVALQVGGTTISETVTPVRNEAYMAEATFAMAVAGSATPSSLTLTVDGTEVSLGSHALTAGKIYNQRLHNINEAPQTTIKNGEKWIIYGTGATVDRDIIFPFGGATVTLYNVNMTGRFSCRVNSTIILADGTTNTLTRSSGPAIQVSSGQSLTIKGSGTLNVTGGDGNPAIGPLVTNSETGGDITIESTVHLKATAGAYYDKAITTNGGGTVTIGGEVYDGGATSPFTYPAPTLAQTMTTAGMTVKVMYNYSEDEENYCLFLSNGNGTYTLQSGGGYAGGDGDCAKALVVEDGKLVFKQNYMDTIDDAWDDFGFSVTFNTSNNTYSEWKSEFAAGQFASFISVEVNGATIAVTAAQ